MLPPLSPRMTHGAAIRRIDSDGWRLSIPGGKRGSYRLAQLDDYSGLPRRRFPWKPPITLQVRARASAEEIPGTWGFGLWNDPFSLSLGLGGASRRFPALPNTAWFFFASPPNHLSLRDDLPGHGSLAATFRAAWGAFLAIGAGLPLLPLIILPAAARALRRASTRFIQQDAAALPGLSATDWHEYRLRWQSDRVNFWVDGVPCMETAVPPAGPLGLVLWIDNQYAAFTPQGRIGYGTLPNPAPSWIELKALSLAHG